MVTPYDVVKTLSQPQKALYAEGMAVNLLYDKLRILAEPQADIRSFYGLPALSEPLTLQQAASAQLYAKIMAATAGPDPSASVTTEQLAELVGLKSEQLIKLVERPSSAYSVVKGATLVANSVMQILEKKA